jgi:hypothetical protein
MSSTCSETQPSLHHPQFLSVTFLLLCDFCNLSNINLLYTTFYLQSGKSLQSLRCPLMKPCSSNNSTVPLIVELLFTFAHWSLYVGISKSFQKPSIRTATAILTEKNDVRKKRPLRKTVTSYERIGYVENSSLRDNFSFLKYNGQLGNLPGYYAWALLVSTWFD